MSKATVVTHVFVDDWDVVYVDGKHTMDLYLDNLTVEDFFADLARAGVNSKDGFVYKHLDLSNYPIEVELEEGPPYELADLLWLAGLPPGADQ